MGGLHGYNYPKWYYGYDERLVRSIKAQELGELQSS